MGKVVDILTRKEVTAPPIPLRPVVYKRYRIDWLGVIIWGVLSLFSVSFMIALMWVTGVLGWLMRVGTSIYSAHLVLAEIIVACILAIVFGRLLDPHRKRREFVPPSAIVPPVAAPPRRNPDGPRPAA